MQRGEETYLSSASHQHIMNKLQLHRIYQLSFVDKIPGDGFLWPQATLSVAPQKATQSGWGL
jgi:hypothetical protein